MSAQSPEEIHSLVEAAFNAGDVDAYMALHEPDATLIAPPAGLPATGLDAIRAAIEPMFALRPSARMDVVGKVESDGLALTYGRWTIESTDPEGEFFGMSGRGTLVSRRQPDRSWMIVMDNPLSP